MMVKPTERLLRLFNEYGQAHHHGRWAETEVRNTRYIIYTIIIKNSGTIAGPGKGTCQLQFHASYFNARFWLQGQDWSEYNFAALSTSVPMKSLPHMTLESLLSRWSTYRTVFRAQLVRQPHERSSRVGEQRIQDNTSVLKYGR
jgi:hypothetical protein